MNANERELNIKLDMLEALSRSQQALVRIIQSVADVSDQAPGFSRHLFDNMEVLSQYQKALAEHLVTIRVPHKKKGQPQAPWIAPLMQVKEKR